MKKNIYLAMACMACIVLNASAQFSSNGNGGSSTVSDNSGWSTVYVEWNPSSFVYTGKGDDDDFDGGFNGFSLGYSRAISLSSSTPLFLEAGLAGQFSLWKEDYKYKTDKISILSLKAPVNLIYKFDLPNSTVSLLPFAGLTLRGNLWGEEKYEYEDDLGSHSKSYNLFDKDDMDGKANTWKRFQIGWQIGLKARFAERFIISGSYGTDFSEIKKKFKVHTGTVSVGYTF